MCVNKRASNNKALSLFALAIYGVGPGAVDPAGIGEGASTEPCVFGGFILADLLDAGALLNMHLNSAPVLSIEGPVAGASRRAVVEVLVPLVPDCSHDVRNVMPVRRAIRENTCFFISLYLFRAAQSLWLS